MKRLTFSHILKIFLAFLAIATAIKILFVGYDIDEQYALAMSYRLLKGDFPVRDMWEPHQTSGFLTSLLMFPYVSFTRSTTGIVLYLRICGLAIHSLTAFLFYRQAKFLFTKYTSLDLDFRKDICLLIVCIYFFSLPKLMFFPEFSNMQLWFLLLMILCISHYYTHILSHQKVSPFWLSAAGLCLAVEVLSYPSSLLLFPVCIYYIFHCQQYMKTDTDLALKRHFLPRELILFCLPCIFSALLFIGYLLTRMSFQELIALLPFAISDGSHAFVLKDKLLINGRSFLEILYFFIIYGLIAFVISIPLKNKVPFRTLWSILLLCVTLLGQVFIWILGKHYPNYPSVEYFFVPFLILTLMPRHAWTGTEKMISLPYIIFPLTAFAGIIFMTNHPLLVSAPFLGLCASGVLLCLFLYSKKSQALLQPLLFLWVFVLLFGKCYMVRTTGGMHYTLFHPLSIIREGPAAYIIADTDTVQQYRDSCYLVRETIPEHAKVFYIGTSNGIYLMEDMEFCTPSTISSPTFDEKTELYFVLHPEKFPDYIICDSQLSALNGNSFLSEYLSDYCIPEPVSENDFLVIYQTKDISALSSE